MKVLLVGSASQYAIEKPYLKYLKEIVGEKNVSLFAAQNRFLEYYRKSILNKIIYRLGLSQILNKINLELKNEINVFKPDVVWIFKGMEVLPTTLAWIRKQKIKLVNYNPDNPFVFTGRGSGNKNITQSIDLYDLHFTYDRAIEEKLRNDFNANTFVLPFGFDIPDSTFDQSRAQTEVLKTCFVGNPDTDRASFLRTLAEKNIQIDVYGNGWEKVLQHNNINLMGAVYADELWMTLARYRIQLNLMRVHNPESHNMRTFEVPGVGGILLAPDTKDHRIFFEQGREIILYTSVNDCVDKINTTLALPESEAKEIRRAARDRSITSGYRYKDRTSLVFSQFNTLVRG